MQLLGSATYRFLTGRAGFGHPVNHVEEPPLGNLDWAHDLIPGLPLAAGVPKQDEFDKRFLWGVARNRVRRMLNRPGSESMESLASWNALYRTLPRPNQAAWFLDERWFGWQRVAGANPRALRRMTELPSEFPVQTRVALDEGRLYGVDNRWFEGKEPGAFHGVKKYMAAPLAVFTPDADGVLRCLAIQCVPGGPVFTPEDGFRWWMARSVVATFDANHHELCSHLGETHLVMECFAVASKRALPPRHPARLLLQPHLEFTLHINHSAANRLLAKGGPVCSLLAPSLSQCIDITVDHMKQYRFDAAFLEADLKSRGMDDDDILYPYRDDARRLNGIIRRYVESWVEQSFHTDEDVQFDEALQRFHHELVSPNGGRLAGVPRLNTRAALTDVLAQAIFIASVQHTAANLPQYEMLGYPPATPGALYAPAPDFDAPDTREAWHQYMPPLEAGLIQIETLFELSAIQGNVLGQQKVLDKRLEPIVRELRVDLDAAQQMMTKRDLSAPWPYRYLHPSTLAASVHI